MNAEKFLNLPEEERERQLTYCATLGLLSVNEVTNRGFSKHYGYNALEFVDQDTRQEILLKVKTERDFGYAISYEEISKLVDWKENIWGYKDYVDNTHGYRLTNHRNRYWIQMFEERLPFIEVGDQFLCRTVQQVMLHKKVWTMRGEKEKTKIVKDCIFVIPKVSSVLDNRDKFFSRRGLNGGFTIQGVWEFYMPSDNLAMHLQCTAATGVFLLVGYCEKQDQAYPHHIFEDLSHVPLSAESEIYTL